MSKHPMTIYRPVRSSDGQGGIDTSKSATSTIWGEYHYHDNRVEIRGVHTSEDVKLTDEVELEGERYRVEAIRHYPGQLTKVLEVVKVERPTS